MMSPPTNGATSGAAPMTMITKDMARAALAPVNRSRMMAREMTGPAAAPNPWMKRAPVSTFIPVLIRHSPVPSR